MEIEKIYVYPVKALRAVELDSVQCTKHGFPHDRRFMIVRVKNNEDGSSTYTNVHVSDTPESILFHPSLDLANEQVTITYQPAQSQTRTETTTMSFPLHPDTANLETIPIEMHKSPTTAFKMPDQYNSWLSDCYGFPAALAYLGPNYRPVLMSSEHGKPAPAPVQQQQQQSKSSWLSYATSLLNPFTSAQESAAAVTFADVAPYLVVSSRSMDSLQPRLPQDSEEKMDIIKFRPNIIVSGADEPWEEDYWGEITISGEDGTSDTKIECVHNCGRCKSINIDYATGRPGKGPTGQMLKHMQRDRRVDQGVKYSPIFGRYSFLHPDSEGNVIRIGDKVVVSKKLEERTRFDWAGLAT